MPNVYNVRGTYTGKIVFLGACPEKVYDICWKFDPNVVIAPARDKWLRDDTPQGFDWNLTSEYERIIAHDPYIRLSEEEIGQVINQL